MGVSVKPAPSLPRLLLPSAGATTCSPVPTAVARAAAIYSLIGTAKLNCVDPEA